MPGHKSSGYHTTCYRCHQKMQRTTGRTCGRCLGRKKTENGSANGGWGEATVRRLHQLRLRADAGLPLFG